jgi:plasmid stability protein
MVPIWNLLSGGSEMSTLTLKNIPEELHRQLKNTAKQHHRSLNNEAIVCLETALRTVRTNTATFLERARHLRKKTSRHFLTQTELSKTIQSGRL